MEMTTVKWLQFNSEESQGMRFSQCQWRFKNSGVSRHVKR